MTAADANAVLTTGWLEQVILEAPEVAGIFNMTIWMTEGSGVDFDDAHDPTQNNVQFVDGEALSTSYLNYAERIDKLVETAKNEAS